MTDPELNNQETKVETVWDKLGDEVPFRYSNDYNKAESFRNERAQEMLERDLNSNMTDIEELELFAESGVDGLSMDTAEFEGKKIKVIKAQGYPLNMLIHSVNSSHVKKNPNIWLKKESEFNSFNRGVTGSEFDPNVEGSASNVISMTYVNTDINAYMLIDAYAFTAIRPNSIIRASSGDIWSTGDEGKNRPTILEPGSANDAERYKAPDTIAEESKGNQLNEFVIKRYDEKGDPLLPTAIIAVHLSAIEEKISDDTKRAAATFNIPIIFVTKDAYDLSRPEKTETNWNENDEETNFDFDDEDWM